MFDSLGIQGNREVFSDLVTLLKTGKAIGFVGAGASAPLYPLWTDLIEKLAAQVPAVDQRQRNFWRNQASKDPVGIAKQLRSRSDRGSFNQTILDLFGPRENDPFTPTHRALLSLPFSAFVTTNYDPGLDFACAALGTARRAVPFTWRDDNVTRWENRKAQELWILHAHGRFDRSDTIVLDIDDYRDVYGSPDPYSELLGNLFVHEKLVFVGFSFADEWLKAFADRSLTRSGKRDKTGPLHFAIQPLDTDELDDAEYHAGRQTESLRTRTLFYPVRNGDHSALGTVLDALIAEVSGKPPARDGPKAPRSRSQLDILSPDLGHLENTREPSALLEPSFRTETPKLNQITLGLKLGDGSGPVGESSHRPGGSAEPSRSPRTVRTVGTGSGADYSKTIQIIQMSDLPFGERPLRWITQLRGQAQPKGFDYVVVSGSSRDSAEPGSSGRGLSRGDRAEIVEELSNLLRTRKGYQDRIVLLPGENADLTWSADIRPLEDLTFVVLSRRAQGEPPLADLVRELQRAAEVVEEFEYNASTPTLLVTARPLVLDSKSERETVQQIRQLLDRLRVTFNLYGRGPVTCLGPDPFGCPHFALGTGFSARQGQLRANAISIRMTFAQGDSGSYRNIHSVAIDALRWLEIKQFSSPTHFLLGEFDAFFQKDLKADAPTSPSFSDDLDHIHSLIQEGQKAFCVRGLPGVGKHAFWQELQEPGIEGCRLVPFQLRGSVDDFQQQLGRAEADVNAALALPNPLNILIAVFDLAVSSDGCSAGPWTRTPNPAEPEPKRDFKSWILGAWHLTPMFPAVCERSLENLCRFGANFVAKGVMSFLPGSRSSSGKIGSLSST